MLPQELLLPGRTLAGANTILRLLPEAAAFGNSGLLVHGRSLEKSGMLTKILATSPALSITPHVHAGNEPTTSDIDALRRVLQNTRPDWIAAVGGGSVLDLAKAAAALLESPLPCAEHLAGAPIPGSRLPLLLAPTTAGTGSEATIVAVMTDPARDLKASFRHPSIMPRVVILDSALLASCPPSVIAASGLDAFVQAVESHTSRHATDFTRQFSGLAAQRIAASLSPVFHGDFSRAAELLEGSYLAGIALSHARLGLVHGLAHPLGCRYRAAHGLVCALCLPAVLRFNRDVSRETLQDLSVLIGRDVSILVQDWLAEFSLSNIFSGQPILARDAMIRETLASGSTKANPREVTAEDVGVVLGEIFMECGDLSPLSVSDARPFIQKK